MHYHEANKNMPKEQNNELLGKFLYTANPSERTINLRTLHEHNILYNLVKTGDTGTSQNYGTAPIVIQPNYPQEEQAGHTSVTQTTQAIHIHSTTRLVMLVPRDITTP